jgi:hypothetical protein
LSVPGIVAATPEPLPSCEPVINLTGAGVVYINSTPSGADVYIDNSYIGITPIEAEDIAQGNHILMLRMPGYDDWTEEISGGQESRVSAVMSASKSSGNRSSAPPAAVTVFALAIGIVAAALISRKNKN